MSTGGRRIVSWHERAESGWVYHVQVYEGRRRVSYGGGTAQTQTRCLARLREMVHRLRGKEVPGHTVYPGNRARE